MTHLRNLKRHILAAGTALVLMLALAGPLSPTAARAAGHLPACTSVSQAQNANTLVSPSSPALTIIVRPDAPSVGKPVLAWLDGHRPGDLLVARKVKWNLSDAVGILKANNGGSATTIYLTPGDKVISVSVTDLSGKKKKASCRLTVTW